MKKLYLDAIDRPDLLKLDIDSVRHNPPYVAAWEYVENNDYAKIVDDLAISKKS